MTETASKANRGAPRDEPPPLLGTWRRMYLAVIGWLVFLIIAFYLFARRFTP